MDEPRDGAGNYRFMNDGVFDHMVAPFYDRSSGEMFRPEVLGPTVEFLHRLAGDGPVLEFASGTGRVALALADRGVEVHGIELSRAMVAEMAAKPGADRIPVTIGDMATTRLERRFSLVYLVYNTIGNLLTQDEQVECFANAAAHLRPGGAFVVELFVPELRRLPPGEMLVPFDAGPGHGGVDEYDPLRQRLISHHYWVGEDRQSYVATPQRYAWPAELDLMARLAGLSFTERWAGWDRSEFTAESDSHVSVWTLG